MKLELNSFENLTITTKRLGDDRNPLVIVDNVFSNAEEIRRFALETRWSRGSKNNYYPGYVSACRLAGTTELVNWAANYCWTDCYGLGQIPAINLEDLSGNAFFALFAPEPTGKFVNVHSDGHSWLAVLIYLSEGHTNRGTAFWRDRSTGLQSLVKGDAPFLQKLEKIFGVNMLSTLKNTYVDTPVVSMDEIYRNFLDDRAQSGSFPTASYGDWELIDFVPERFNRMIVYPTWQFHSVGYPDYVPPADIEKARLTLNMFIEYPVAGRSDERLPVSDVRGIIL